MRTTTILLALLLSALAISLAGAQAAQIIPYSNATQTGYRMLNISTDSVTTLIINNHTFKYTQNFITPSTTGITINNVSYSLNASQTVTISSEPGLYATLVKVNYIPRLHTVDLNLYVTVSTTTTTTTMVTSTVSATVAPSTIMTTVAPPPVSVAPTTTMQQSTSGTLGGIISQLIAAIKSFLSKL